MIQLTVKVPRNELDALRYACAHTDEKMFVHETSDPYSQLANVTLQVRSIELLYYLVRSFDAKVECDKSRAHTEKLNDLYGK